MINLISVTKTLIILLILIFLFSITGSGLAQMPQSQIQLDHPVSASPLDPAFRSLLFPGLGQLKNKQNTKGYVFIGIGAVLLGTTLYMNAVQNNLWRDYEASRDESDYNAYKNSVYQVNISLGLTAGFWLYNVVDAYLGAR